MGGRLPLTYPTHVQGRQEQSQIKLKALKSEEGLLMFSSPLSLNAIGWQGGQVFKRRGGGVSGQRITLARAETARLHRQRRVITPQRSFYRTRESLPSGRHANQARHPGPGTMAPCVPPSVWVGGAEATSRPGPINLARRGFHTRTMENAVRARWKQTVELQTDLANVPQNRYLSGRRPEDHGRYSDT